MRAFSAILALMATGLLLSACGQKNAAPEQAEAPGEPAALASPATPNPAQVKALLATLPAPFDAADPEHGKHIFAQCAACHTNAQGAPNMTGPNLYGLFGRRAGGVADYSYSDVLKAAGFTWDAARINTWITSPQAMLPGTKMTFLGLKDAKDRADVIAYLKVSTTPAP